MVIWIKQEQTWNLRLYWSKIGTWEQTEAKWPLEVNQTGAKWSLEVNQTGAKWSLEVNQTGAKCTLEVNQTGAKMGLGNRQKQSGHLMLIRQKQRYDFGSDRSKDETWDPWDKTGAKGSFDVNQTGDKMGLGIRQEQNGHQVNQTGERYLGSDGKKS